MTLATHSPSQTSASDVVDAALARTWTADDQKQFVKRQKTNEGAVKIAAVLAATAVLLGAGVLTWGATVGAPDASENPAGPTGAVALGNMESAGAVSYETAAIEAVAGPAVDNITYAWRSELQGWTIVFLEPRGRASGYTWSAEQRIEVFVKGDDDVERTTRVLAHEIGHAVDVTLNTGDERREWLAERDVSPETAWWPGSGRPDFETGAGDFAEVFAATQVGEADFRSKVNLDVDEGDYALMARLSLRDPDA